MAADHRKIPRRRVAGQALLDNSPAAGIVADFREITDKEAETRNNVIIRLLKQLTEATSRKNYLDAVVEIIHGWSGCRCVGIRLLDSEGNIPYESFLGFSEEFVEFENRISVRRDECLCIQALTGTPELYDAAATTPGRSFYCSNIVRFIDGVPDEKRPGIWAPCVRFGFLSSAVIPINYREKLIGAIHLADEREFMTPLKVVEFVELLARLVGEFVHRFDVEDELILNYGFQSVINLILSLSLEDIGLDEFLSRTLNLIIKVPWLAFEAKGAVFLVEGETEILVLKACKGFTRPEIKRCGQVPFGRCLCGRAAQYREVQFAHSIDGSHEVRYEGMTPHGHYCIPIQSGGRVLGVLNLYLRENHRRNKKDEEFLTAVANTMAGIIERRRAEQALVAEKERLAVTLRSIGDGVFTTDVEGRILLVNKVAEKLAGYTNAGAKGQYLHEILTLVNENTGETVNGPVEIALKTGRTFGPAGYVMRVPETEAKRFFSVTCSPIFDTDSIIIGAVLVCRDITGQKKIEEEMLKADKLDSLGILAGGIAHDFNNILMGVILDIYLAKMSLNPGEESFKVLSEAEDALMHAKGLTQQLLTFSKGGAPILKTATIGELIKDSSNFALRGSNARCQFSIPEDLWPVEVDKGQINQVINNLVINAVQAMPDGGMIEVRAENTAVGGDQMLPLEPGAYVKIAVKDHGVGIPRDHLEKIFDPYFTTKRKGSGLGLSTSYSIIKNHGGYIFAESETGRGSTFYIYLPASKNPEAGKKEAEEKQPSGKGRVLIMDDEDGIRNSVGKILAHFGYEVGFAGDGAEALNQYKKAKEAGNPFDAVIMDLTIPGGMGGREAIRRLKEIDPGVKAIVSSGYSSDPIMAKFKKYGFKGVIAKPYKIEELNQVLQRVINLKED